MGLMYTNITITYIFTQISFRYLHSARPMADQINLRFWILYLVTEPGPPTEAVWTKVGEGLPCFTVRLL